MLNNYDLFSNFISQKVMPLVYDESLSYYEVLNKLINYTNDMVTHVNTIIDNNNSLASEYNTFLSQLADLKSQIENLVSSFFIEDGTIGYSKLSNDCRDQLSNLVVDTVHNSAKFLSFGIDDDGYFYADIPDAWNEIVFSTDGSGNLVLEY